MSRYINGNGLGTVIRENKDREQDIWNPTNPKSVPVIDIYDTSGLSLVEIENEGSVIKES